MVFFNYSTMQMAAKVVYYGPGLCGKTTNLQWIFEHTSTDSRGEMVSLATETDRTLFFDLLPIDVGSIAGFNTRIQLYTVPGQVFYNTTRKLVLKGVDGVVFVADSQRNLVQANIDSFKNLEENLAEMGLSLDTIPVVLQYNKRDLPNVCTVEEMNEFMNPHGWPALEASAIRGEGVFETLKTISKATLLALKKRLTKGKESGPSVSSAPRRPMAPKPAPPRKPPVAPPSSSAAPKPPLPAASPRVAPPPVRPVPAPAPTADLAERAGAALEFTPEGPAPQSPEPQSPEPQSPEPQSPEPQNIGLEPVEAKADTSPDPGTDSFAKAEGPTFEFEPSPADEAPLGAAMPSSDSSVAPPVSSKPAGEASGELAFPSLEAPELEAVEVKSVGVDPPEAVEEEAPSALESPASDSPAVSADPFPDLAAAAEVALEPPLAVTEAASPPVPTEASPSPPPAPIESAPSPPPAETPSVPPKAAPKKKRSRGAGFDALAELEKLRKESARPKPAAANGKREINRDFRLTLKRSDLARARRVTLKFQLEDEQQQAVDEVQHLHIELDHAKSLERLLLRLDIALDAKS